MAYIGVQPTDTYLSIASQQITGNGGATYTLDYSVSNEEDVAVFVNNVRQNVSTYTVSGTSLTLGGTISASDSCWVLFLGRTVGTKTPAIGSVTNDMLAGSIANDKLANSSVTVNGTSIVLGASGNISAGITEADQWRVTTDFSGDQSPVASNWERNDTDFALIGTGMTQSSGIFTFPSTGIYFVEYGGVISSTTQNRWCDFLIEFTTNNSTYNLRGSQGTAGFYTNGTDSIYSSARSNCILDVTDTSTHKVRFSIDFHNASAIARCSSSYQYHGATFIRLGDT